MKTTVCMECLTTPTRHGRRVCDHCTRRLAKARVWDEGWRAGWAEAVQFYGVEPMRETDR